MTTGAKPSLQTRALRWLAGREHSRSELRAKLLRAADSEEQAAQVDALLDLLAARGHLSDQRFVEARVHARAARFGNRRIEHELRLHGATADAATLERLRSTELERARQVWRKKFGGQAAGTPAERARQTRFLAGRGFSAEVVRCIVARADDGEEDAAPAGGPDLP